MVSTENIKEELGKVHDNIHVWDIPYLLRDFSENDYYMEYAQDKPDGEIITLHDEDKARLKSIDQVLSECYKKPKFQRWIQYFIQEEITFFEM